MLGKTEREGIERTPLIPTKCSQMAFLELIRTPSRPQGLQSLINLCRIYILVLEKLLVINTKAAPLHRCLCSNMMMMMFEQLIQTRFLKKLTPACE